MLRITGLSLSIATREPSLIIFCLLALFYFAGRLSLSLLTDIGQIAFCVNDENTRIQVSSVVNCVILKINGATPSNHHGF